jgi:flagellar biosynthesis GTPase FlhF
MSSTASTATLAFWDPMEVLSLLNPAKLAITCVGYAPSCRRRCRNPIAARNISSAKVVMRELVRADLSDDEVKNLLFELAEYLICRRHHQNQATVVSDGWWRLVQARLEREEEGGSDTSDDGDDDDGSGSDSDSDSDSDDGSSVRRDRDNENTPLPAEDFLLTLERLQREFDELLQRQRQHLLGGNASTVPAIRAQQLCTTEARQHDNSLRQRLAEQKVEREAEQLRREEAYLLAQREREEARERSRRATAEAEKSRREEAQRQAAREKAQREAEAERLRQEEEAAEAEAKRLRQEEEEAAAAAEKARQDKERQRQARAQAWDDAWLRYEQAWSEVSSTGKPSELDVRMSSIWPTKTGSYSSCSESNVKLFFISQPGSVSRNVIRRQALRWHPDRAARLFGHVKDESQLRELMKAVTMISQVVIGIMAIASR